MPKIIAFDMDDVICSKDQEWDLSDEGRVGQYKTCKPAQEMIDIVNKCYDQGHRIIIYTARGFNGFTGNIHQTYANLYPLTLQQLNDWGVKFHELVMGKIYYDILIDDKALNSLDVKNIESIEKWLK